MPYVKKTYVRKTKKNYKRKPKRFARVPRAQVQLGKGFPRQMTMTHKFIYNDKLTNASGVPSTVATKKFNCNGMFQPVVSGTTHKPLYFDQMSALYMNYTVIGSKINVRFVNNTSVNAGAFVCIFMNDNVAGFPGGITALIEQTKAKYAILDASANAPIKNLGMTWSAKKRVGGSIIGNPEMRGTNAANPVKQNEYVIAMQDLSATTTETCDYIVELEYIAVWTGLREISPS